MSGFESIIDQKRPLQLLTTLLKKGTIPHALLFTGIAGAGKLSAATAFAMACNCRGRGAADREQHAGNAGTPSDVHAVSEPCCVCRSCRKIQSNSHPDVLHIKPSGSIIKIAQIRDLCHTLTMKPFEARLRVVVISQAQAMNPEAANALLKILEEPPESTILILTAEQTSDLLPTIVSRCQQIRFNPISGKSIALYLTRNLKMPADQASIIAGMAGGSLSRALSMSKTGWIDRRNWLLSASGLDNPGELSAKPLNVLLAFAERLSRQKDTLPDALEIIKSWLRDLVVCRYNAGKVINTDMAPTLQKIAGKITPESLLLKIRAIQKAQRNIESNANPRLSLELLMLQLAEKY